MAIPVPITVRIAPLAGPSSSSSAVGPQHDLFHARDEEFVCFDHRRNGAASCPSITTAQFGAEPHTALLINSTLHTDHVFSKHSTADQLYDTVAQPLVPASIPLHTSAYTVLTGSARQAGQRRRNAVAWPQGGSTLYYNRVIATCFLCFQPGASLTVSSCS